MAQVHEAQAYYQVHHELVEADAEEKRLLEAQEEAHVARIPASLEDLKVGRVTAAPPKT